MARFRLAFLLPALFLAAPRPATAQVDPTLPQVGSAEDWDSFPFLGWSSPPNYQVHRDRLLAHERYRDLVWNGTPLGRIAEWTGETWVTSEFQPPDDLRFVLAVGDRLFVGDSRRQLYVHPAEGSMSPVSMDSLLANDNDNPSFGEAVGNTSYLFFPYLRKALSFDGNTWESIALPAPTTEDPYRRVGTAAGHGGRLYCATQPSYGEVGSVLFRLEGDTWAQVDSTGNEIMALVEAEDTLYALVRRSESPFGFGISVIGAGGMGPVGDFPLRENSEGELGIGYPYRVLAHGGGIVVQGDFDRLPDGSPAENFARWRNGTWEPLDSGGTSILHGFDLEEMFVWKDRLVVGGAWGILPNLMMLEGGDWTSLHSFPLFLAGQPQHAFVRPSNDHLVVVGTFAGGEELGSPGLICEYDGTGWTRLGDFVGYPRALTELDGDLVVGGDLWEVGGVPVNHIARLVRSGWEPVGEGFDSTVMALTVHRGSLVAGGRFDRSGETEMHGVAIWTGAAWSPLGRGFPGSGNDYVAGFLEYRGNLVAHGTMKWIGTEATDGIAVWDGGSWRSLAARNRFEGAAVRCAAVTPDGALWVGGDFGSVDDRPAAGLARYDGVEWTPFLAPRLIRPVRLLALGNTLAVAGEIVGFRTRSPVILLRGTEWLETASSPRNYAEDAVPWRGRILFCLANGDLPQFSAWSPPEELNAPPPPPGLTAYPNPARTGAWFSFSLTAGGPARVTVHDLLGREVRVLGGNITGAGSHVLQWNLLDAQGRRVAPGVYFARLEEPTGTATRKMLVLP